MVQGIQAGATARAALAERELRTLKEHVQALEAQRRQLEEALAVRWC